MFESALASLLAFVREYIALAEPLAFALGFAESIVLVSLLVPSTAIFLGMGGIHSAAGGEFLTVWLAAAAGALSGDMATYVMGRYFRHDIKHVWPISARPAWYAFARVYVRRHGVVGVFAGKFGGMIRPFVPLVAGALGMRFSRFAAASLASSLAWAGLVLAPGYALTSAFQWGL